MADAQGDIVTGPRVFDGTNFIPVDAQAAAGSPPPPVEAGNGQIYISIVSYRDGERCARTIQSIFENAKDPDRVVIGLVEQNAPEDKFCMEVYCETFGFKTLDRKTIRTDVVKIVPNEDGRKSCPRYNQVRVVAFFHINAKGPMLARSMSRKTLGNEEFCMQVDAHTTFAKNWDELAIDEWTKTQNEFGIITAVPAPLTAMAASIEGQPQFNKVPRQCKLKFLDNKFPNYISPADGYAIDLDRPLLSYGWSAAFSFAKCHLEESAPYDPFLYFAMPIEQFSRYARFWTRGYDTYTPTRNIVFHDYGVQENGHGNNEWFKRQRDRFRKASISRVKTALQIAEGDPSPQAQANLGIYGLGKRRTLEQLTEFVNIDLQTFRNNEGETCGSVTWVPFDEKISPAEHFFTNPDNLDPQPEFPLRTELVYYQQVERSLLQVDTELEHGMEQHHADAFSQQAAGHETSIPLPPLSLIFVLWLFGIVVWLVMFFGSSGRGDKAPNKKTS